MHHHQQLQQTEGPGLPADMQLRTFKLSVVHKSSVHVQIYFHAFMELVNSFSTVSIDCMLRTPTETMFPWDTFVFKWAPLNISFLNGANSVSFPLEVIRRQCSEKSPHTAVEQYVNQEKHQNRRWWGFHSEVAVRYLLWRYLISLMLILTCATRSHSSVMLILCWLHRVWWSRENQSLQSNKLSSPLPSILPPFSLNISKYDSLLFSCQSFF